MNTKIYNDLLDQVMRHPSHDHDHDHEHADEDVNSVVIAKATAMAVLFLAALLFGLIPFKLADWFKWTDPSADNKWTGQIVSMLLAFGGGVLLCTTFMHLLPEVKENVSMLQASNVLPEFQFNFAELLMCLGFFTMYFVEELVHTYLHKHQKYEKKEENAFRRALSIRESSIVGKRKKSNDQRNGSISIADLIVNDVENEKYQTQVEIVPKKLAGIDPVASIPIDHHHQHHHIHGHSHLSTNNIEADDIVVSSLRGLLIVLALSVHELFEGLAVGLEGSASNVWYMFGAVAAHKLVLAFCVGVELIVTKTQRWLAFVYVLTFAVVSPLGIGIGILVSGSNSENTNLVSAILQGLACGTLLYVVFFEILQKGRSGLLQLLSVLIGFFIMFGLQFISGHEHSHGINLPSDHNEHDHSTVDEKLNLLKVVTEEITSGFSKNNNEN